MKYLIASTLALAVAAPALADDWFPYPAEQTDAAGAVTPISYEPVAKAEQAWPICVSFPHMKDAYWLGVDYGVVEEAKGSASRPISSRPVAIPSFQNRSARSRIALLPAQRPLSSARFPLTG